METTERLAVTREARPEGEVLPKGPDTFPPPNVEISAVHSAQKSKHESIPARNAAGVFSSYCMPGSARFSFTNEKRLQTRHACGFDDL